MSSGLGEQIAVLDGLAAMDPNDGRIGQQRAQVDQYSTPVMPGVTARRNVLDASAGANYSGGSSYAPMLPLLPSSVGLAGCIGCGPLGAAPIPPQAVVGAAAPLVAPWLVGKRPSLRRLRMPFGALPNVLPTRKHVIDYSGGANYSGGSDWVPGLPLLPSSAGLADSFIKGGYGRAGLGAAFIQGGYGRAGLGQTASAVDEDLAGAMEAVETAKALDPADGRIGQQRAQVDEYGKPIMPGVLARSNVLDASEGANYSGGSDYAPGLPLLPSSVGLAGLGQFHSLDGMSDLAVGIPNAVKKIAGRGVINAVKKRAKTLAKRINKVRLNPMARAKASAELQRLGAKLDVARRVRQTAYNNKYAQRLPLWAR